MQYTVMSQSFITDYFGGNNHNDTNDSAVKPACSCMRAVDIKLSSIV
jgi:hypothetical protein